jgi:putative transposase
MPRVARFVLPEVTVHVVQRGHNRGACFRQRADYLVYLAHLRRIAGELRCEVHAYCLMTNHVHLLVTPPEATSLARLMRALGQKYVQYFNRRYARTGTLWEGRFRSCLTESPRYVLACYRYIEMNPVRAGMVRVAADYPWSSYAGNSGLREDELLTPHAEYVALATDRGLRLEAYRALFGGDNRSYVNAIRSATNAGYPLVGETLRARLEAAGHRVGPRRRGRPPKDDGATA